MRIRTQNQPGAARVVRDYPWDKSSTPYIRTQESSINLDTLLWTNGQLDVEEYFEDEVSSNIRVPTEGLRMGTGGHFKECLHVERTNEFNLISRPCRFEHVSMTNTHLGRVNSFMLEEARDILAVPEFDWDALSRQAMAFMLPQLETTTSLVNFLIELKDLKRMDPRASIKALRSSVRFRDFRHGRGSIGRSWVADTALRLAGAHLMTAFGILPLIRDIADAKQGLDDLAFKLQRLKQFAGSPQQRYYKRVLPYENGLFRPRGYSESIVRQGQTLSSANFYNDSLGGYSGRDALREVTLTSQWVLRPTYHATLRYIYDIPKMGDAEEKLKSYSQTLGVRLDPAIVWNAIPFSFLVDWVVDVSGFLSDFAKNSFPINTRVLEFCHSISWHKEHWASVDMTIDDPTLDPGVHPPLQPEDFHPQIVWRGADRTYERRVANPDPSNYNATTNLTARKAALAGSLMVSNSKSLRKLSRKYRNFRART